MEKELEEKMRTEHYEKYEKLAQHIGVYGLCNLVKPYRKEIKQALENGDEHLNSIMLSRWDRLAGAKPRYLSSSTVRGDFILSWEYPWIPAKVNGLSLAERVCVLKHVAKYHCDLEETSICG